jgi:hypothetical protein
MAKYQRKVAAALAYRNAEYDKRDQYGKQVSGGDKVAKMMHKPGSQNRRKGWGNHVGNR